MKVQVVVKVQPDELERDLVARQVRNRRLNHRPQLWQCSQVLRDLLVVLRGYLVLSLLQMRATVARLAWALLRQAQENALYFDPAVERDVVAVLDQYPLCRMSE